jgi:hypothetical protein
MDNKQIETALAQKFTEHRIKELKAEIEYVLQQ